jgi:hypothetical protein
MTALSPNTSFQNGSKCIRSDETPLNRRRRVARFAEPVLSAQSEREGYLALDPIWRTSAERLKKFAHGQARAYSLAPSPGRKTVSAPDALGADAQIRQHRQVHG